MHCSVGRLATLEVSFRSYAVTKTVPSVYLGASLASVHRELEPSRVAFDLNEIVIAVSVRNIDDCP